MPAPADWLSWASIASGVVGWAIATWRYAARQGISNIGFALSKFLTGALAPSAVLLILAAFDPKYLQYLTDPPLFIFLSGFTVILIIVYTIWWPKSGD